MRRTHYEILQVKETAAASEIKQAYRRLARKLHPDVNKGKDAANRMSEVNTAYAILSDREQRSSYDAQRKTGFREAPRPPTSASPVYVRHHISIVDLPSPVYSLAFSPAKRELAIGCFDNTVRIASVNTGKSLAEIALEGGAVSALCWVNRDTIVGAGISEKTVSIWRIEKRKPAHYVSKKAEWVSQLAISPDGRMVVLGSVHKSLSAIDANGETIFERKRHDDAISSLAISANGRLIASGSADQRVILWDAATGLETAVIGPLRAATAPMAFAKDTSQLAVSLIDQGIRIFELKTGTTKNVLWGHDKPIESLAFHPSGWLLASASRDNSVRLWDTTTGKQLEKLGGHSAPVRSVVFSADGKYLVSAGLDRVVSIWRIAL